MDLRLLLAGWFILVALLAIRVLIKNLPPQFIKDWVGETPWALGLAIAALLYAVVGVIVAATYWVATGSVPTNLLGGLGAAAMSLAVGGLMVLILEGPEIT